MNILVSGSLGLVGSTTADYFLKKGHTVVGIDNDMRSVFFGTSGSTKENLKHLTCEKKYIHYNTDIRDQETIKNIFKKHQFHAVIHTAAQPSHDKAKEIPVLDFEVNTLGTLHLLEITRTHSPNAVFIFTSTNKVYGDNPNKVALVEKKPDIALQTKNLSVLMKKLQ